MLEPEERERLALLIRERALCYSVAWADAEEIDSINILQATMLAMRRALLGPAPSRRSRCSSMATAVPAVTVSGFECLFEAVIKGDATVPSISAASILAKTTRDALMRDLDHALSGLLALRPQGISHALARRGVQGAGPESVASAQFCPGARQRCSKRTSADLRFDGRRRFGACAAVSDVGAAPGTGQTNMPVVGADPGRERRAASSGRLMK